MGILDGLMETGSGAKITSIGKRYIDSYRISYYAAIPNSDE
ncbi:Uncharacterised protein [Chlamydia trachomatis]|nr:Uncharacterised protein [Chlamydia trachomatis]